MTLISRRLHELLVSSMKPVEYSEYAEITGETRMMEVVELR